MFFYKAFKISIKILHHVGFDPTTESTLITSMMKFSSFFVTLSLLVLTIFKFFMVELNPEILLENLESMGSLLQVKI